MIYEEFHSLFLSLSLSLSHLHADVNRTCKVVVHRHFNRSSDFFLISFISLCSLFLLRFMSCWSKVYLYITCLEIMQDVHHFENLPYLIPVFLFLLMRSCLLGLVMRLYLVTVPRYSSRWNIGASSCTFIDINRIFQTLFHMLVCFLNSLSDTSTFLRFQCLIQLSKEVIQFGRDYEYTAGKHLSSRSIWTGNWNSLKID